jgi:hypothetical protein
MKRSLIAWEVSTVADKLTLIRRGKAVSREEAAEAPIVVAGSGLPDQGSGYVFDTDDEFYGWVREVGQSEIVARLDEATEKGREQENHVDEARLEAWQRKRIDRITDDLNDLAQLYGLPVGSSELLRKATIEADPLIGPVFHSFVLFDDTTCGGAFRPITGLMPKFGWIGFNNRASSANGFGSAVLFSRYWFKAKKLYLFSIASCLSLHDLSYDNMASSAVVF